MRSNLEADLAPWEERWVWLIGSLLVAFLVSWIGWAIRHLEGRPRAWYDQWQRWPGRPWVSHTLRLMYAVGVPTAALLWRGALKASALGLQPFPWQHNDLLTALPSNWEDWLRDALWALGLGAGVSILLYQAQATLRRAGMTLPTLRKDGAASLREAVIHEAHWAFYREPLLLLWETPLGAWAGLLLVLLEAVCNPARWRDLRSPATSRSLLLRAALGVTSTILFLQTQNLWLAILSHTLLDWLWGVTAGNAISEKHVTTTDAEAAPASW